MARSHRALPVACRKSREIEKHKSKGSRFERGDVRALVKMRALAHTVSLGFAAVSRVRRSADARIASVSLSE